MSIGLTTPSHKTSIVTELDKNSRMDVMEQPRYGKGIRKGKNDIFIATWNVRTLGKPGALQNLKEEMRKYRIGLVAIQETRWHGSGILQSGEYTLMYSGNTRGVVGAQGGTGFLINNKYKPAIKNFTPINERMCTIRMESKFFNITIVCVYAPTEEADGQDKDEFYSRLEQEIDCIPKHDVKILIGDLNAKVGREEAFRDTVGKESLHEYSNDNGLRLIDLATSNAMVVRSTWHQRKNVRKITWCSPDGITQNQIDHVLIDRRHASDILQVDSCRGADSDSDHYLVRIKYRQRIAIYRGAKKSKALPRYDEEKFKTEGSTVNRYQMMMDAQFQGKDAEWREEDIEGKSRIITEVLHSTAQEVLGEKKKTERAGWFDDECRKKVRERNEARKRMLNRKTRTNTEEYKQKRREADRECRLKKREFERNWIAEMEEQNKNKEIRKFYLGVKDVRKGFQPRTVFCKDKQGNLIGGKDGILDRWTEYFSELLNQNLEYGDKDWELSEDVEHLEGGEDNDRMEAIPTIEEVSAAIKAQKNYKAPGIDNITAEMIKKGGKELVVRLHQLICEIWEQERMPEQWSMAIICPIHKKNDKTCCDNYRGIALLSTVYKVFTKILARRLMPFTEAILGDYQCGFRPNRSTTDQIFSVRQIMEKCYEYNIDIHQLFVDFRQAYDSIIRGKLFEAMREIRMPTKIIRLVSMTLKDTKCMVKIEGALTGDFVVNQGLRQGDILSTILFNIALEKVMRRVDVSNPGGTLLNRLSQNLAYADDIDMMTRRLQDLEAGLARLEEAAGEMGLQVNQAKTKYMFSSRTRGAGDDHRIKLNGGYYDKCRNFKYLGSLITTDNNKSDEIKARIAAGNRSYYALLKIFKSRSLSRNLKIKVYRSVVKPVVTYGSEAWTLTVTDEELLRRWERKILRKLYGAVNDNGQWRIRKNEEIKDLYKLPDIVADIKSSRLRWLGHVERMPESSVVKKVYKGKPGGRRLQGRPRKRWLDDVEEDLRRMGVRRWRTKAENREEWARIVREAKALQGL